MRFLLFLLLAAVPALAADPVLIAVRSRPTGTDAVVSVGQAAALTGGTEAAREKMAKLDLIERAEVEAISRRLIRYRLRLAGFEDADFTFGDGTPAAPAPLPAVGKGLPLTAEAVEEAAKAELTRRFGKSPDELFIDVVQPVGAKLPAAGPDDAVELAAVPAGGVVKLGRTQMTVTVKVNGERKAQVPVVLNASEVRAVGGKVPAVVVIKARQPVTMTARTTTGVLIQDSGEAMHDAKLGEPIKVKNSRTGVVVAGTVAGPEAVELPVPEGK